MALNFKSMYIIPQRGRGSHHSLRATRTGGLRPFLSGSRVPFLDGPRRRIRRPHALHTAIAMSGERAGAAAAWRSFVSVARVKLRKVAMHQSQRSRPLSRPRARVNLRPQALLVFPGSARVAIYRSEAASGRRGPVDLLRN